MARQDKTSADKARARQQGQVKDEGVSARFPIVGIGASAGGLEALDKFLTNLDPKSGFAIVVVTHMDPHHKSLMTELLSKRTQMAVHEAEDGQVVELDSIYIIPPTATSSSRTASCNSSRRPRRAAFASPLTSFSARSPRTGGKRPFASCSRARVATAPWA